MSKATRVTLRLEWRPANFISFSERRSPLTIMLILSNFPCSHESRLWWFAILLHLSPWSALVSCIGSHVVMLLMCKSTRGLSVAKSHHVSMSSSSTQQLRRSSCCLKVATSHRRWRGVLCHRQSSALSWLASFNFTSCSRPRFVGKRHWSRGSFTLWWLEMGLICRSSFLTLTCLFNRLNQSSLMVFGEENARVWWLLLTISLVDVDTVFFDLLLRIRRPSRLFII